MRKPDKLRVNDELVDPEELEKYQRFMPVRMKELLQRWNQKTQMETWSRLVILKMWILTICSVGVFSIALLCIYQGKITEGLGLIGRGSTGGNCRCNH